MAQGQREGELGPAEMLARRNGYTVADPSSLFGASFLREDIIECGCDMHARRYFIKALDRRDARAALPVAAFKRLYDIEAAMKGRDAAHTLRERRRWSAPLHGKPVAWGDRAITLAGPDAIRWLGPRQGARPKVRTTTQEGAAQVPGDDHVPTSARRTNLNRRSSMNAIDHAGKRPRPVLA